MSQWIRSKGELERFWWDTKSKRWNLAIGQILQDRVQNLEETWKGILLLKIFRNLSDKWPNLECHKEATSLVTELQFETDIQATSVHLFVWKIVEKTYNPWLKPGSEESVSFYFTENVQNKWWLQIK